MCLIGNTAIWLDAPVFGPYFQGALISAENWVGGARLVNNHVWNAQIIYINKVQARIEATTRSG